MCIIDRCEIYENNVNSKPETLFHEITEKTPDVYAFSCYIWNIQTVVPLCEHIKTNNPQAVIILGGPEVSFNPAYYLKNGIADYVQCGDGEKAMSALCLLYTSIDVVIYCVKSGIFKYLKLFIVAFSVV